MLSRSGRPCIDVRNTAETGMTKRCPDVRTADDSRKPQKSVASGSSSLEFAQSRAAYESLVNSLPLSVLIKDTDGRRLFANHAYLETRGLGTR